MKNKVVLDMRKFNGHHMNSLSVYQQISNIVDNPRQGGSGTWRLESPTYGLGSGITESTIDTVRDDVSSGTSEGLNIDDSGGGVNGGGDTFFEPIYTWSVI